MPLECVFSVLDTAFVCSVLDTAFVCSVSDTAFVCSVLDTGSCMLARIENGSNEINNDV